MIILGNSFKNWLTKNCVLLSIGVIVPIYTSAQDARQIAKNTFPSIVVLEMRDQYGRSTKLGSGFFVTSSIVVTNFHVIQGAHSGTAKIVGQSATFEIEGTIGIEPSRDLALLKLTGASGKPLRLADLSTIEAGQHVYAFGNPRGLEGTISPGIVSGLNIRNFESESLIQITAPISPGSSGGPVVNGQGEVIGVAVSSLTGQNLNFAIPATYVSILLSQSRNEDVKRLAGNVDVGSKSYVSSSNASLRDTESWLSNILVGEMGRWGKERTFYFAEPEGTRFSECKMYYRKKESADFGIMSITEAVAPMALLESVSTVPEEQHRSAGYLVETQITLKFSIDIPYKWQVFFKPVRSGSDKTKSLDIWVQRMETANRIKTALEHLKNLCGEAKTKEPF